MHLSLKAPVCRANEDWLEVQAFYLEQLRALSDEHGAPVICAGDIFDKWNAPPELVNFALEHLPTGMICVPGQHDLPNHQMDQMHRSGYGVLARTEKIVDLMSKDGILETSEFTAHGYGWNQEVKCLKGDSQKPDIAVVHQFVWISEENKYKDAPEDSYYKAMKDLFDTYDAVVIGDNHRHWRTRSVFNCGCFIRRKSDEIPYNPVVGLLYKDRKIETVQLNTSIDRFHDVTTGPEHEDVLLDIRGFVQGLEKLGEHGMDFREAVRRAVNDMELTEQTKAIVLASLEER